MLPPKKTQARAQQSIMFQGDFLNYNRFDMVKEVKFCLFEVLTHL